MLRQAQHERTGSRRPAHHIQKARTTMSWKFELLMKPSRITEGPVWDGEHLYFTHILTSRILRHDPKTGEIVEWRSGTNRTNGLAFDRGGQLFGCCSGGRAILRF